VGFRPLHLKSINTTHAALCLKQEKELAPVPSASTRSGAGGKGGGSGRVVVVVPHSGSRDGPYAVGWGRDGARRRRGRGAICTAGTPPGSASSDMLSGDEVFRCQGGLQEDSGSKLGTQGEKGFIRALLEVLSNLPRLMVGSPSPPTYR